MIIVNDPGAYLTEEENLLENLSMELVATLRKSDSGLPANLYLDDTGNWSKSGHWKGSSFSRIQATVL
jgi:hypothetical protein